MIEKKQFKELDKIYLLVVGLILVASTIVQATASYGVHPEDPYFYFKKHLFAIATGLVVFVVASMIDYREYRVFSRLLLGVLILMLVLVLIPGIGSMRNNARSWFVFGPLALQPAEIAKIIYIIVFADFLERRRDRLASFGNFLVCMVFMFVPVGLILLQPDMGTALVFFAITFFMMFAAGVNRKILFSVIGIGMAIVVGALWLHFSFGMPLPLDDYQIMRFTVFLDPYNDGKGGLGAGYNIIQSLIAIGSGGLWGKGFLQGTQSQANFLPYHHTDFVFAVIGEEFGFIGSIIILGLFLLLLYRMLFIATKSYDRYGAILIHGITGLLFFHILQSIGMTIGVMPITGIPLPFLSSGGSSLWTNMAALGIVISIDLRKKDLSF